MPRFDLNLLVPLDALLRERSVTAAAEHIGVSQPTMSGMLSRLREQLRDPLFVRVGRSFELTPRATELADDVRQLLLTAEALVRPTSEGSLDVAERHFKIMASEFSILTILPEVFREAAAEAAHLTFEVVPISAPSDRVFAGDVDLCLTGNIMSDIDGWAATTLRTKLLLSDRFVGLVDVDHPIGGEMTLDEFLAYPHVVTQFPGIPRTVEDRGILGTSSTSPPRIRVPSFIGIGAIISKTDYIGVFPERLLYLIPEIWGVRTVELPSQFARISTRLLWHNRHDRDAVHRWLREAVVRAAKSLGDEIHHLHAAA